MIDIHCHILPEVDDGPQTLADSLELARLAESEGITKIIATPHHQHPSFENDGFSVLRKVEELNEALQKANIHITVIASQEIRIHGEIIQHLELGDVLPTTPGGSYLLVEFPSNSVPHYTTRLFYDLQMKGYTPIIAHPERNKVFKEDPSILYELVKNGSLTQVTASSLTGHLGKKVKRFTEQLIDANLTHFISSDAHHVKERPFRLLEAYSEVEKGFGIETVYEYKENAELLLGNQHVQVGTPEPVKKRIGLFNLF
ncbi:tyrosine-protein phosphatase [Halalkalibacter alkalisediminis]|uniref:Tyrosine-protein phosphatase n=1 Tax=Halalkalibacter alkalisediminis TaxID=935616 RepID=A0ABV6NJ96_9BACI|nr:CpsB/CapC family capsule biosynthesis tyrosine phosphatase [Halalkalibacter alkalisediminis]